MIPFTVEKFADDAFIYCKTQGGSKHELHPTKIKILYYKDKDSVDR